jgi:hypothetical protein
MWPVHITILAVKKLYYVSQTICDYVFFYPAWKAHARRIFIRGVFGPTLFVKIIA